MATGRLGRQPRDIFKRMASRGEEEEGNDDLSGSGGDASVERFGDGRRRQLHVGGLDGNETVSGFGGDGARDFVQLLVGLHATATVIYKNKRLLHVFV